MSILIYCLSAINSAIFERFPDSMIGVVKVQNINNTYSLPLNELLPIETKILWRKGRMGSKISWWNNLVHQLIMR